MKPKLLDLFCKAGGAAKGYAIVGVDNKPQPRYPFEFIQADWEEPLHYLPGLWERDGIPYAVHASPPCQRFSTMTKKWGRQDSHPDLVASVREELQALEVPYVIDWMTGNELAEAIPPAYTEYIGKYLIKHLEANQ